ncbi:ROK family transcriptional regulator [Streptococcus panodentis]|uniref:Sugar kinase n=1 Tax=Streptococcus panodentis TaxID=1581472 RepID=A0ABS5AZA8_9STRE|nr:MULTISPECIES: ROK family transcriptional regulator [Streptococcus]KXT83388.1 putative ROK-family transcriptional regulator [Streptococcus sp. DD11]MBP2621928.1 sugar kinase [Streptococcus panodentis]
MTRTKKQTELRATVLDQLYAKRPISRIDISKESHITPATTGTIINQLIKEGLVLELGELSDDSVGRKKTLLDIAPRQRCYLGFEISEKQLAAAITDNVGEVIESACQPYQIDWTGGPSDSEIIRFIKDFLQKNSQHPISAIAVALPGHPNLSESDFIVSKNPHWGQINLRTIQEAFSVPVYFANKSHCLTLAERLFSYHPADSNFIVYHLARGIHCSYMYRGSIYSQDNFLIGEVGHTVMNPEGERCPCGKNGCLQVYASESSLIDKAAILHQSSQTSLLKTLVAEPSDIQLDTLLAAYRLGDLGSIELIHTACRYLAISISNLCQLIDTERIYLDGEFFSSPLIAEQILAQLEQAAPLFPKQKQAEIIIIPYSQLNIARAAVSLCVYHEFLDKNSTF